MTERRHHKAQDVAIAALIFAVAFLLVQVAANLYHDYEVRACTNHGHEWFEGHCSDSQP